jgi:hypothetical protein
MLGVIRRDGDTVLILAMSGVPKEQRPANFDNPPVGWWLMTLKRGH